MLKKALAAGDLVVGSWVLSGSPIIANIMVDSNLDFVVIDAEHGPMDLPQVHDMLRGAGWFGTLVRTEGWNDWNIKRYLDAGAEGVIVPRIEWPGQLGIVMDAAFYPPQGKRGLGYAASNSYGLELTDGFAHDNETVVVIPQIETKEGIINLAGILGLGPDAAMIGPWDLTASLGIPGQFGHTDYLQTLDYFLQMCKKYHVAPGIHIAEPDLRACTTAMRHGFQFIAYGMDVTIIRKAVDVAAEHLRMVKGWDNDAPCLDA